MSKRREQFEKGMERLQGYCEILCSEPDEPSLKDIQSEILAIPALRTLPIRIHLPDPFNTEGERFMLIAEHYERYDDVLPKAVDLRVMPLSMDDEKELHRFLREQ